MFAAVTTTLTKTTVSRDVVLHATHPQHKATKLMNHRCVPVRPGLFGRRNVGRQRTCENAQSSLRHTLSLPHYCQYLQCTPRTCIATARCPTHAIPPPYHAPLRSCARNELPPHPLPHSPPNSTTTGGPRSAIRPTRTGPRPSTPSSRPRPPSSRSCRPSNVCVSHFFSLFLVSPSKIFKDSVPGPVLCAIVVRPAATPIRWGRWRLPHRWWWWPPSLGSAETLLLCPIFSVRTLYVAPRVIPGLTEPTLCKIERPCRPHPGPL